MDGERISGIYTRRSKALWYVRNGFRSAADPSRSLQIPPRAPVEIHPAAGSLLHERTTPDKRTYPPGAGVSVLHESPSPDKGRQPRHRPNGYLPPHGHRPNGYLPVSCHALNGYLPPRFLPVTSTPRPCYVSPFSRSFKRRGAAGASRPVVYTSIAERPHTGSSWPVLHASFGAGAVQQWGGEKANV